MKVIYFDSYKEKKFDKRYGSIKNDLDKIENKLKLAKSMKEVSFYQDISNRKKIIRFSDSQGGFRLALFFYDDCCLFIDFEKKQTLEAKTSEVLFENYKDEFLIDYIIKNKPKEKVEKIDLNDYKSLLELTDENEYGEICFESKNFSNSLNSREKKDVFNLLQKYIVDYKENEIYYPYSTIYMIEDKKEKVFYKLFIDDEISVVFLLNEDDDFQTIDKITSKDELLKKAVKSYPLEIFLEESEDWIEYIVKNSDGNIALSPEEENILIELKSYSSEQKYPFFINGRAGSGKSTILQYLFAEYVVEFLKLSQNKELEYTPLYLTYNDRLKDKAIDKVTSIILAKTKKDIREKLNLTNKIAIQRQIEKYFKTFSSNEGFNFLEELLYENKKENSLKSATKISFEEIKEYFSNLIKRKGKKFKNYTPELIWYVIRSYIKGRGVIEDDKLQPLTPNEYKNLDKKLKTIKEDFYETIYKEFYNTYQKYLKDKNLYDDLDLIFEIYKQKAFDKKYSVIFCDEAQDFTKIEFDMILNLNIFLDDNIKIDNLDSKNIPIVFAGDPFQTINPTGFSFEYLKALVYEVYYKKGIKTQLNYKELQFNYRSNDDIIKFSNLIQTLRGVVFRDKNIALQTRWLDNFSNQHSILYFDKNLELENTNNYHYQFIFPTNKKECFQENDFISTIERLDIPIDVKGLEYPMVVLYGFGDFYINNYENISNFIENSFSDKEVALPYEYFLNNFYVAITRAKEKIIIIDSIKAKEEFWDKIDIDTLYTKFKELNQNITKDELLSFKDGMNTDLDLDEETEIAYTIDRLKTEIFERYDDEKNKTLILNEIEKVLKIKELNEVYSLILSGLKAENNENYLKAVKSLMKAANKAKKNGELSRSQITYLMKKAFNNLLRSVQLEDKVTLELLEEYKDEFKSLSIKNEEKVILLEKFLNSKYTETLDYLIDSFDVRDRNDILTFIIFKALNNVEDYEIADYLKELFNKDFIDKKEIIDVIKSRLVNKNYKSLIKVFSIEELQKEYKDVYCQINLEINKNDIDCLIHSNQIEKVISLINSTNIDITNYYRQILYYISKTKTFEVLDNLELNLVINNYLEFFNEFDIKIWEWIIINVFNNRDNIEFNDRILKISEFLENSLAKKELIEHLKVLTSILTIQEGEFRHKELFNTLYSYLTTLSNYPICDTIVSLEKTMSLLEENDIVKVLMFYKNYLQDRKNKYKGLVGSRFIKLKYEYDKFDRARYNKTNEEWFEFVKTRVKFLKVESDYFIMRRIPARLNKELCEKVRNIKLVDEIYQKIINEFKKEENEKIDEIIQKNDEKLQENEKNKVKENKEIAETKENKTLPVSKENVIEVLKETQKIIFKNRKSFDDTEIMELFNTISGIKNLVDSLMMK